MLTELDYARSPSMRREWIEITNSAVRISADTKSPSMRREWIEMGNIGVTTSQQMVSLHAEGVD